MFIAALFTIAKTWKQPKCPSTDEGIKTMWYLQTGILLSHKKNETMPFVVTCMDLEVNMLSEVWQKRQIHNITYTENLRNSLGGSLVLWWFEFGGFAAMATFIHIGHPEIPQTAWHGQKKRVQMNL